MNDKELERIAELLFQKFLDREQKYLEDNDIPNGWVSNSNATGTWYTYSTSSSFNSTEVLIQKLVELNIEKQELIEEEKYEELIKLQEEIDEIKKLLKDNKD
tara:strand:- start:567 stop:872 length:306 start_codon:yes stop_codon:yes gene_type:complete